jgi:exosome complex component RRP4
MQKNDSRQNPREIVVPGDLLAESGMKAGPGAFSEGGRIYAGLMGIKIVDLGASNWLVDIRSPYPSPLHVNEVPWRVEFGETSRFMTVGDLVLLKIVGVDELMKVQLSMKEHGLRKLAGGMVPEIAPSKVPRVIGRNGSMIQILKNATGCRIYVGQNGRIWIDGDLESIQRAVEAISLIEEEAHNTGLTEKIKQLLDRSPSKGA